MFAAGFLVAVPIAFYFEVPMVITAIVGPMFLIHLWTAQKFAHYSRADRPALFWGAFALFAFVTVVAFWELYQHFIEVRQ